jgi:hypothetical protein
MAGARSSVRRGQMRHLWLVGVLLAGSCPGASAMDLWSFNGRCKEALVKQGSPYVEMHNIRGSPISCDAAFIMELDNGRKLVQFVQKRGKVSPPGFAGSEFKYTGGNYSLIVDRVYPQRILAGKTTEQTFSESARTAIPAEGYCFFSNSDFSKLTEFSCVTKQRTLTRKSSTEWYLRLTIYPSNGIYKDRMKTNPPRPRRRTQRTKVSIGFSNTLCSVKH